MALVAVFSVARAGQLPKRAARRVASLLSGLLLMSFGPPQTAAPAPAPAPTALEPLTPASRRAYAEPLYTSPKAEKAAAPDPELSADTPPKDQLDPLNPSPEL